MWLVWTEVYIVAGVIVVNFVAAVAVACAVAYVAWSGSRGPRPPFGY